MPKERDRVGLPQTVRVTEIRAETRSISTFVLDAQLPGAEPGQFVMLWLPGLDEKPMSVASAAPLTVVVDRVGPFTMALHELRPGSLVGWRGPYGRGFRLPETGSALLVSGGCGVGPMYFLATRTCAQGTPTTVALGARTRRDLPYVDALRAVGAEVVLATDDGSLGYRGYVTDAVADAGLLTPDVTAYACGPEPMLVAFQRQCRTAGISAQVSVERYMKCGFGICGQCALDGLLVCQDGPVFDVRELDGVSDFGHAHRTATGRRLPLR
jgi:dihydroorotate dehydrogenase electron transfer subunit